MHHRRLVKRYLLARPHQSVHASYPLSSFLAISWIPIAIQFNPCPFLFLIPHLRVIPTFPEFELTIPLRHRGPSASHRPRDSASSSPTGPPSRIFDAAALSLNERIVTVSFPSSFILSACASFSNPRSDCATRCTYEQTPTTCPHDRETSIHYAARKAPPRLPICLALPSTPAARNDPLTVPYLWLGFLHQKSTRKVG